MIMTEAHTFWDKIAERYARKPVPDQDVYRRKLAITQGYFTPDMKVFEFGCGTGSTAIAHAPFVDHVYAIDDFSAPDKSFDVVLGLSILHLVEDKEAIIAKVRKMLKPGGIFVSSTACLGDKLWFFKCIEPIGRFLGLMPMVKVFTVKELDESLTGAGFDIDQHWVLEKGHTAFIVAKQPE